MVKIWAKTEEFSEGKYLVVRRDGTIPAWPHFRTRRERYRLRRQRLRHMQMMPDGRGLDSEYVASVRELRLKTSRNAITGKQTQMLGLTGKTTRQSSNSCVAKAT